MQRCGSCERFPWGERLADRCGFTLIEVMITMVIASLVLLTLTAGSGFVIREWARQNDRLDDRLDTGLLWLRIERAMAGAFPHLLVETVENRQEKTIFFEGGDREVSWVSTVAPGTIRGLAAWRIDNGDGGVRITVVPAGGGDPLKRLDAAEPVAVIPGQSFTVRYLGEKKGAAGSEPQRRWETAWPGRDRRELPAAVLFTFTGEDADRPGHLLVPVRARRNEQVRPRQ